MYLRFPAIQFPILSFSFDVALLTGNSNSSLKWFVEMLLVASEYSFLKSLIWIRSLGERLQLFINLAVQNVLGPAFSLWNIQIFLVVI